MIEDFKGNKKESNRWRSFSEARAYVHSLGLQNKAQWQDYSQSGKRPYDIPSNPDAVYCTEFKGYGDWLGTGTIATWKRRYRPFAQARAYVHTLKLKNIKEWREYCKSGKKPVDIPTMPERYTSDYKGMGDWLGTGNIASSKRVFRPFAEARSYVRSLKLQNQDAWLAYCTSGQKPTDIPSNPATAYLAEFESYGDWLGNGNIHKGKITYRPFTEARDFARSLDLKSHKDWQEYCKSGKKPLDIPSDPKRFYSSEYKGIRDWLGIRINTSLNRRKEFLPFTEARAFVQKLKLTNHDDWLDYCKSGKKPKNIPSHPSQVYHSEYRGIKDWLGVVDKWDRNTLLTFLQDLQTQLGNLTKKDLVSILQENGTLNLFRKILGGVTSIRVVNDLMNNGGR